MSAFCDEQAVLRFVALVLGTALLITAVLPPSLGWLRDRRRNNYGQCRSGR
jgi:Na+/melibiose symporter-like transporter